MTHAIARSGFACCILHESLRVAAGGIETGRTTEMHGVSEAGKTQMLLTLAVTFQVRHGKTVLGYACRCCA